MQHTDKARADFEAWMKRRHPGIDWIIDRADDDENIYRNPGVEGHWESWQASRASVVVELPQHDPDSNEPFDVGFCRAIEELRAAAVATGLTVKE